MELLGRRRHGRAREVEWELGGGRHHEGGRAVGGRQGEEEKNTGEREGEGRMKKNRWRTHHRRVILQSGGDAYVSPPVRNMTRR